MGANLTQYLAYFDGLKHINSENKKAFHWFLDECAAEGLSEVRQCKYVFGFVTLLSKFVPTELKLNRASESQLKSIVAAIHRSKYTESTQCFLKQCFKKFYKLKHGGRYPKKVEFIKTTQRKYPTIQKEELYTREEIRRIASQLWSLRDRAFVMVQYESAARTGELLKASLGDVYFEENGDFIKLKGVKGTPDRVIQLVESGPYLKEWICAHPLGGDPYNVKDRSSPLWVKLEQQECRHCGKTKRKHKESSQCSHYEPLYTDPMEIAIIYRNFKNACIKAGIKRRSYRLYNLRHTRITEVASFLKGEYLNKFAGWKPGSGQPHIYVHLDSEDINKSIREHYSLSEEEKSEPIACRICWRKNPPETKECLNCRRPLTVKALNENRKVEEVREALKVLAELQEQGKLEELVKVAKGLTSNTSS